MKAFHAYHRTTSMPGAVRQFEPQITRSGGAASQYRFTTRCSGCHKTDTFEASRPVGDDQVRGYFRQRGWVLGRDRAYDLCPACLAKPQGSEPPRPFRDSRSGPAAPTKQPGPATRTAAPAERRHRDTADILSRHLGNSEALAAEVFRPRETQPPRLSTLDSALQPGQSPALPPEMERALIGMSADLKGLRSAMELMAEQVSKL